MVFQEYDRLRSVIFVPMDTLLYFYVNILNIHPKLERLKITMDVALVVGKYVKTDERLFATFSR